MLAKRNVHAQRGHNAEQTPCWTKCREDSRRRKVQSHEGAEMTQGQEEEHGVTTNTSIDEAGTNGDRNYWRPSYMFHWLRAVGGDVEDAYKHFPRYNGKQSYEELQLDEPEPMVKEEEDDNSSVWSHMSDYDEIGSMPDFEVPEGESIEIEQTPKGEECLRPKIVRSNHVGTTRDVYDHEGTTHVDCISSTEETTGTPKGENEIKNEYPWHYANENKVKIVHEPRQGKTMWRDVQQTHFVKHWSTAEAEARKEPQHSKSCGTEANGINCFVRGTTSKRPTRKSMRFEEDDSDEEEEQMVCAMTGRVWESFPFPVIIDSGACASVMPNGWCKHVPFQKRRSPNRESSSGQPTEAKSSMKDNGQCP